jgi:hypothetical protein
MCTVHRAKARVRIVVWKVLNAGGCGRYWP